MRRATFGPTQDSIRTISALGAASWLDQQLSESDIEDDECNEFIDRFPLLQKRPEELSRLRAARLIDVSDLPRMLCKTMLARALWSERQLFEVMTWFWANHLNIYAEQDGQAYVRHEFHNEVIRRHALGRFDEMLEAAVTHPSMLVYLGNHRSRKDCPNENLARELLELHTVGLGAQASEADVLNVARILTGLSVEGETTRLRYNAKDHWLGRVQVLGFDHPNDDPNAGPSVSRLLAIYLAHHPSTARHIAKKLAMRFVSDNPSTSLIERLAAVYSESDTAIKPVLVALFSSPDFAKSQGQKIKTPAEDVLSTVRALGFRPDLRGTMSANYLYIALTQLGDRPLGWRTPDGAPDTAGAWSSPAVKQFLWNLHYAAAGHAWPFATMATEERASSQLLTVPITFDNLVGRLSDALTIQPLRASQIAAIAGFFRITPTTVVSSRWLTDERLRELETLLFDSPQHALR